jgi:hypothetical protein
MVMYIDKYNYTNPVEVTMTLNNVPPDVIDKIATQSQEAIHTLIVSAELVRTSKKSTTSVNFFESFFKQAKKHILL